VGIEDGRGVTVNTAIVHPRRDQERMKRQYDCGASSSSSLIIQMMQTS